MITDKISNAQGYIGLSEGINKAIAYINNTDLEAMENGKYEIDGDNLFVLIQSYVPKTMETAKCEAHKNYIDIQYVIEGREHMGYGPVDDMEIVEAYDSVKDRYFVKFTGDMLLYEAGMFALFFPQDAHMPGVKAPGCDFVRKAVVKIKVEA